VSDFTRWCVSVLIVSGTGMVGFPFLGLWSLDAGPTWLDDVIEPAWISSVIVAVLTAVALLIGSVWGWL
jgi:hypothetical protein